MSNVGLCKNMLNENAVLVQENKTQHFYLVHVKKMGGASEELLWKDKPWLVNSLLWLIAVVGLLYGG